MYRILSVIECVNGGARAPASLAKWKTADALRITFALRMVVCWLLTTGPRFSSCGIVEFIMRESKPWTCAHYTLKLPS